MFYSKPVDWWFCGILLTNILGMMCKSLFTIQEGLQGFWTLLICVSTTGWWFQTYFLWSTLLWLHLSSFIHKWAFKQQKGWLKQQNGGTRGICSGDIQLVAGFQLSPKDLWAFGYGFQFRFFIWQLCYNIIFCLLSRMFYFAKSWRTSKHEETTLIIGCEATGQWAWNVLFCIKFFWW